MRINAIASATCKKQFAAHLINEDTEIIFLDELTSNSLNAEDAKKVLQGGLQILPQKNREACQLHCKSGIIITTNELSRPRWSRNP